jgi:hypothetical protein
MQSTLRWGNLLFRNRFNGNKLIKKYPVMYKMAGYFFNV